VSLARRSKEKTAEASSFFLNQEASAIDGPAAHKFFSFLVLIAEARDPCAAPRARAAKSFFPRVPLAVPQPVRLFSHRS
jgi:hypothetical protein